MPSKHLILCHPLLLPSIFPSVKIFSNESVLRIRWPKDWNFSFSISPSNEYSGLISFRKDWLDLLAVQWALKSPPIPKYTSTSSSALSLLYGPMIIRSFFSISLPLDWCLLGGPSSPWTNCSLHLGSPLSRLCSKRQVLSGPVLSR